LGRPYLRLDVDDGCTRRVEADFRDWGEIAGRPKSFGDFFFCGLGKTTPVTVALRDVCFEG